MEQESAIRKYIREHKTELIIDGLIAVAAGVGVYMIWDYGFNAGYLAAENRISKDLKRELVNNWQSITFKSDDDRQMTMYVPNRQLSAFGGIENVAEFVKTDKVPIEYVKVH